MSKNKKLEQLNKIKDHIDRLELSEDEKSNSYKHIEEWYEEDKSFGELYGVLAKISPKIEAIFEELGLI